MPSFRTGRVLRLTSQRPGLQRLVVSIDGREHPAFALVDLTGPVDPGDEVVVNTTAVELGLGTGGDHVVHWNLSRATLDLPGPDHVMKLRYTSLQLDAGTAELAHPECDRPIDGTPVIACSLHSQVPLVVLAALAVRPGLRIAYVMTDGGALPLALSDLVAAMTERDLLCGTVTAGHAFGGDLEAVNVASALGLAVHVQGADVVVVGMGPGVVGTGTELGTTALEAATTLDLADAAGGVPVLCVRVATRDDRARHVGISHHTRTIARVSRCTPLVADTGGEERDLEGVVAMAVPVVPDAAALLAAHDLDVRTMGRGPDDDPAAFASACAAGALAALRVP
ncbi:MAG: DUF3866 family protein [Microthrixaceae bacterium]